LANGHEPDHLSRFQLILAHACSHAHTLVASYCKYITFHSLKFTVARLTPSRPLALVQTSNKKGYPPARSGVFIPQTTLRAYQRFTQEKITLGHSWIGYYALTASILQDLLHQRIRIPTKLVQTVSKNYQMQPYPP
jgi:hypothetical protein